MVIVMEFLGDSELMERGLVDTGIVSPKVLPELLNIIILHLVASVAIWRPRRGTSIYDVRSGLGRGSPKNRQKEQNQLISDSDKGGGGQKIRKICGRHMWKPSRGKVWSTTVVRWQYQHLNICQTPQPTAEMNPSH